MQELTPDCFLEAAIAAVVRTDIKTITDMLGTPKANIRTVTMYNANGDPIELQVAAALLSNVRHDFKLSKSCWVAVLQDAYSQILSSQNRPDEVHLEGLAPDALMAFYEKKFPMMSLDCSQTSLLLAGQKALSKPATFDTKSGEGELAGGHCYTIHAANSSHLILRNP